MKRSGEKTGRLGRWVLVALELALVVVGLLLAIPLADSAVEFLLLAIPLLLILLAELLNSAVEATVERGVRRRRHREEGRYRLREEAWGHGGRSSQDRDGQG